MTTAGGRTPRATVAGQARPVTPSSPARRPAGAVHRPQQHVSPTAAPGDGEPRKVKLTVSRVDPFSVMRISFLLSVAVGIAGVVVVCALWLMLNSMGVFSTINDSLVELQSASNADSRFSIVDFLSFGRVVALAVVFGIVDVILLTAIATITAFIYNMCAALVGGAAVTLTDE